MNDFYTCFRCKGVFLEADMSSNAGRYTYCKKCYNEKKKEQRLINLEHYREYQREWYKKDRLLEPEKYQIKDSNKYQKDILLRPERILARNKVHELTRARSNTSIKQPCKVCGAIAEAHHTDYSKPLDVEWLCPVHHREVHRG